MRAFNLFSTVALSAPVDAGSAAPSLPLDGADATPAKPARAKRLPRKPKPVTVAAPTAPEPAPAPEAAPVAAEPADAPKLIGTARTCAVIARNATNFGGTLSDRDLAYIAFYASLAGAPGVTVTISDIANCGRGPAYGGSAKPHDAGVVNRLRKAGLLTVEADGTSFHFTDKAATLKAFAAGAATHG